MSFGEAIKSVFSKYATFSGRARRSEYWYFALFNFLIGLVLAIIGKILPFLAILSSLYGLAILIPGIAISVRRLHDIGKSGWTMLIYLIPAIIYGVLLSIMLIKHFEGEEPNLTLYIIFGIITFITFVLAIVFIVWMCRDSQPGENKWGPNPKEVPSKSDSGMNY
jgi:uncharacterized membrane protein YhaH (DUF805 family)